MTSRPSKRRLHNSKSPPLMWDKVTPHGTQSIQVKRSPPNFACKERMIISMNMCCKQIRQGSKHHGTQVPAAAKQIVLSLGKEANPMERHATMFHQPGRLPNCAQYTWKAALFLRYLVYFWLAKACARHLPCNASPNSNSRRRKGQRLSEAQLPMVHKC